MSSRYKMFRWFKEGYTGLIRTVVFAALAFAVGALFAYWSMQRWVTVELWGGLTSLYMLIVGICTGICFMIFVEMLGLGADEEKTGSK